MILDIVLTLFARAFKALANIAVIALVARILGRVDLGGYFYSYGLSTPLSFLLPLGVGVAVIKFVAKSRVGREEGNTPYQIIFSANLVVLLFSLLVSAAVFLVCYFIELSALSHLQLAQTCLIGVVAGMLNLQSDCFRSIGLYKESSLYSNSIPSALTLGFLFIVWALDSYLNLDLVLWICLAALFVAWVVSTLVLFRGMSGSVNRPSVRAAIRIALPLFSNGTGNLAGSAVGVFLPSLALIFCGEYFGSEEAAELGLAQRVLFFVTLPLWIASTVLPPKVSGLLYGGRLDELRRLLGAFSAGIGVISLLISIAITGFATEILSLVAGGTFPTAEKILMILSWASSFYAVFGVSISVVMVSRSNQALYFSLFLSVVVFFIGALGTRDALGVIGVACAQSVALLSHAFYSNYVLNKTIGVLVYPDFSAAHAALRRRLRRL